MVLVPRMCACSWLSTFLKFVVQNCCLCWQVQVILVSYRHLVMKSKIWSHFAPQIVTWKKNKVRQNCVFPHHLPFLSIYLCKGNLSCSHKNFIYRLFSLHRKLSHIDYFSYTKTLVMNPHL